MNGLDLANQLSQPHPRQQLITRIRSEQHALRRSAEAAVEPAVQMSGAVEQRSALRRDVPLPTVPDWKRRIFRDLSLEYLWPYLNAQMLYGKHMGLRGNVQSSSSRVTQRQSRSRSVSTPSSVRWWSSS